MRFTLSFSESPVRMLASSQRQIYVMRDGSLQSRVSVRCQSLGGSAVPLVDYMPVHSTRLLFDVGVRSQPVNLTTLSGGKPVPDLDFHVVLFAAQGATRLLTLFLGSVVEVCGNGFLISVPSIPVKKFPFPPSEILIFIPILIPLPKKVPTPSQ